MASVPDLLTYQIPDTSRTLKLVMSQPSAFMDMAHQLGAAEPQHVAQTLQALAQLCLADDWLDALSRQLSEVLPQPSPTPGDVDRVLVQLHSFLQASRSPQAWLTLFEREPAALTTLLQVFAASKTLAQWLIADPEVFDLLRLTQGQPVARDVLQDEVLSQVQATTDLRGAMRVLREYRQREMLRIAFGEMLKQHAVETVTAQLTDLADSIVEGAVWAARRDVAARLPPAIDLAEVPQAFCVLALGKLGGCEPDYSGELELLMIHHADSLRPTTPSAGAGLPGQQQHLVDYFQQLGQVILRLLSEPTSLGIAYQVKLPLRSDSGHGPVVASVDVARNYYDTSGRTWERQAFVKARPIAADRNLGREFIADLQPWIYRRYLMRADITGLAALKRRLFNHCSTSADLEPASEIGPRIDAAVIDVEVIVQFFQLLHGGEEASVRVTNTLEAVQHLRAAQSLTGDEANTLLECYRQLRRWQHQSQIAAPRLSVERERCEQILTRTCKTVELLLQQSFVESFEGTIESDLILDPEPSQQVIESTLAPFEFRDPRAAYQRLQELAVESIPFLSTRRCRHFLAAIAPQLLQALAATPSPDATLNALADVSHSLGGKAGLWELMNAYPATLKLCVRLCACSPYLTSILTSNPGMIDELMDSLMLERLPTQEEMSHELAQLCRGASDIGPMLHSFKNSMHLRVGVRDLLGKASIAQTHQSLAAIAEVCLEQVIEHEFHRLVQQLGMPTQAAAAGGHQAAELVVLAVGKFGGGEPNYHSDIDVIFLFDVEGQTQSLVPNRRFVATSNRHFFNQLCQRIIHFVTSAAGGGRLYELDVHLRPLGRSGELAITIDDLRRYFADGGGGVAERQVLCKARPIWGSPCIQRDAMQCVKEILTIQPWPTCWTEEIFANRIEHQRNSSPLNLKRGSGGTLDIEFAVQFLQMVHAHAHPQVLVPGTLAALQHLSQAGLLATDVVQQLSDDYEFLRSIESGIRLMNLTARHELPSSPAALRRLAYLISRPTSDSQRNLVGTRLGESSDDRSASPLSANQWNADNLVEQCQTAQQRCRKQFLKLFDSDYIL